MQRYFCDTHQQARAFDGLFAELARLQDASVATAREIAEAQRQAAAALQTAIDTGAVSNPADVGIAQALAANARTLASIALAPLTTDGAATGDVLSRLLRQNVELLHNAAPGNEDGLAAFKEYEALQARSEQLAVALQDAWAAIARR